jgi:signal transduction histidine kinase
MKNHTDERLKKICQITGASAAIWLARTEQEWEFLRYAGFSSLRLKELKKWLQGSANTSWLAGSLANNRPRSRNIRQFSPKLGFSRLYLYPNPATQAILLVGADHLDRKSRDTLRLFASFGPEKQFFPEMDLDSHVLEQQWDLNVESAYDLAGVLHQVIVYLIEASNASGGWVALRTGGVFVVRVVEQVNERYLGRELSVEETPWLAKILDEQRGMYGLYQRNRSADLRLPHEDVSRISWLATPVVIGQRMIGLVYLWRPQHQPFNEVELTRITSLANRSASQIENAIIFSEATRYLQQLALVNELATAASSGSDIHEVADRLLTRLRRVFPGVEVSFLVLSSDKAWLREYGLPESRPQDESGRWPLDGSLPGYAIKMEKPFNLRRLEDAPAGVELPPGIQSELVAPLRYRGKVVGVLVLSASEPEAFSRQDEQLLVMLAGHLASLLENVRLNDEMRKRALNLSLIHEVMQKVVGLTDPSQIAVHAASLMAEQFDYDFVEILLYTDSGKELVLSGIAGNIPVSAEIHTRYPATVKSMDKMLTSHESHIVEDLSTLPTPHPITGLRTGSEISVVLYGNERPIGIVTALRRKSFAFTENDRLAMEALAGVLSSVLTNAQRYQELQTTVRQLEAARETGLEIAADLDLDILLRRVVRRARELIGARGAELALVDEQAEIVRTVVSDNPWRDFTGTEVPYMSGVEGKVAVLGEPLVVADYNNWAGRMYPERHMPYRTVAGIPLKLKNKVIGVLLVSDDRQDKEFRSEDLQLLEFFAAQAAVFIRNARLYQEIQDRMEAQRQAEMQLVRSARLAAVGEMAAGVAHELNNPLTTVAGFIELVLDELSEDSPQRQDLELVLREAKRARGVVRRLLDFSRPGDNLRVRTDINEVVSEVLTLVQHLVRTSGVELRVQLREDLPWIRVDPNQIKQVLLNLVHNALQAMQSGGTLSIITALTEKENVPWMTISVQDTGEGIHPEYLDRIFEPFFTTRPVGTGTGLGLSVSFGIINEHGGFIEVDSKPGEGSRFTVWLPVEDHG